MIEVKPSSCPHCATPVEEGARHAPFCCAGCKEVHALLAEQRLTRWYDLARGEGVPVPPRSSERSYAWLQPLLEQGDRRGAGLCELELDVQGIHCAACVWLMNELYRREDGAGSITVNPALGKVRLAFDRARFDVERFLAGIERFGYLFGPSRKSSDGSSRGLLIRLGICAALTMNVMSFSVSFYLGLAPTDGLLFELFTKLSVWMSAIVVAVGGWPFFRAAYEGLRRRVLHLDLPIAAGIVLAFGTSLVKAKDGRGDLAYFDTINTFVTLMLVGRWLQQRLLERNRRFLLDDGGAEGIHVRREEGGRLGVVNAALVRAGDVLVVAPGDLVPVDGTLVDGKGEVSTDWINGESEPRAVGAGDTIPAGSFNAGRTALRLRAQTAFTESPLPKLLRAGATEGTTNGYAKFAQLLSRWYVPVVLSLSAVGLAIWWPVSPDRALDVTVSLLVVTCPCAVGVAIPLAIELALARLRRGGVFVRASDLLTRATKVRKVLFDKTGTLSLGRLELADPAAIAALDGDARAALYDMASRSNHPVSRCVAQALAGARFDPDAQVTEVAGRGLELVRDGRTWRFGAPSWAAPGARAPEGAAALACDGVLAGALATRESMRSDAREEVAALQGAGYEVWLVSGDTPKKVLAAAHELGLPPERALAAQRPEDKAEAVARLDRGDTLFVGDGVNDSLAFSRAFATGSPAVDRPVMPGKADFFLLGEGVGGVRQLFASTQSLRLTIRKTLGIALAYNALAIAACLAGVMTPLRAAVAMPASTLTVILVVVASLAGRAKASQQPRPTRATPRQEAVSWT